MPPLEISGTFCSIHTKSFCPDNHLFDMCTKCVVHELQRRVFTLLPCGGLYYLQGVVVPEQILITVQERLVAGQPVCCAHLSGWNSVFSSVGVNNPRLSGHVRGRVTLLMWDQVGYINKPFCLHLEARSNMYMVAQKWIYFAEYSFSDSMQSNWHVTNSEVWLPLCLPYDLSSLHLCGDP